MSLDLGAIEQRAAAATPGPWWTEEWSCGWTVTDRPQGTLLDAEDGGVPVVERRGDAEFIAHAREDVPALVAEVKRLRRERDHEKRKAADFEDRYETSHASRMHAEDCYRREHRAVERVRALHTERPNDWWSDGDCATDRWKPTECALCIRPWPCPTIRALDGVS